MTLALSGLCKTYSGRHGPVVRAVIDLDLDVAAGEIVALLGSSGCGKTSTLRMIAGFERVSEGTITLAGRRIETLAPHLRGVSMAFEGYALYPPLSIAENIGFGLRQSRRFPSREAVMARVAEIAEMLEIGDLLARRPSQLSGGQQQRVSLARALVRDADLHLLDEPMGQLEPQLRAVLRGRVKAALKSAGATAVLVTHDQTEANAMADRIAVMEAGVLQQCGPGSVLREAPANLFVATFIGEPPMNALPALVVPSGLRPLCAEEVTIALPAVPLPAPGSRVVFGVRPHHLDLGAGALRGTVISQQWLGDQAHVVIEFAGHILVAVSHARVSVRIGETIPFGFAETHVHIFDGENGRALAHGVMPA